MAKNKKSFVLYCDMIHTVDLLPDEMAGKLLKIILQYVNDENPQIDDPMLKVAFEPIRQQLKRDLKKYEERAERARENGAKGGRPKGSTKKKPETQKTESVIPEPEKPTETVSETVSVKVDEKENVTVIIPPKKEKPKVKSIPDRKEEFKKLLDPFKYTYTADMLNKFYSYWTEHGPKDRKMRFEKEKSFDVKKRLIRWRDNQKRFNGETGKTGRDTRTGAPGTNERKNFG